MKTSFKKLFFDRNGHSLKESFQIVYVTLRRLFYFKFRKKHVLKMVGKRKGRCNQCTCCDLWFWKGPCEYLAGKNCLIHNQPNKDPRPKCHLYPFDEKDKMPFYRNNCGFYWDDKNKK